MIILICPFYLFESVLYDDTIADSRIINPFSLLTILWCRIQFGWKMCVGVCVQFKDVIVIRC